LAGLLPDPDVSYTPFDWNFYLWVVSLLFEVAFLALFVRRRDGPFGRSALDISQITLSGLRILILVAMTAIYWLPLRSANTDVTNTPEETERLLNGDVASNRKIGYGSTPDRSKGVLEPRVGDAQTTTWLDYVVGFKKLFPFLW
jgi:ATP-binding cassette, subfamily B, vacuolar membrane transporter HMT1/ACLQ